MEFNATFLISAISFIVFVFIMNAVLYQPVMKIMDERKAFIDKNEQDVLNANSETNDYKAKKEEELSLAKTEAKNIVEKGTEKFTEENKNILSNYTSEQKSKIEEEKGKLRQESEDSKEYLNKSSEDIAQIISNKILEV